MIYFLALLPATALTIAGYFVLFLANRSEGALRSFGKYLGFWAFTLAGLVILGAIFAAAHVHRYGGPMGGHGMYGRMPGFWPGGQPRFFGPHGEQEPCGASGAPPPGAAPPSVSPPSAPPAPSH